MKHLKIIFIFTIAISLAGCSSISGKKDHTELQPSPCACIELVNHAHG